LLLAGLRPALCTPQLSEPLSSVVGAARRVYGRETIVASEEYWESTKTELLDPEFGAKAHFGYDHKELLKGCAVAESLRNVVKLRVLGLDDLATTVLTHFIPPLRDLLSDDQLCKELRDPTDMRPPSLIFHLETLAVGSWLESGAYDLPVLVRLLKEVERDPDYKPRNIDPLSFNHAILAASENGDLQTVERFYRKWEKRPLDGPPTNQRYSSNPRHVLVAHERYGSRESLRTFLADGLERLRRRATNWEKMDVVPFVGILYLARLVWRCERIRGNRISFHELWALLR